MSIFNKKDGGLTDVIRCDEPEYLIWKWHPAGVQLGMGKRENEIRWGSALRVKEGSVAVFVHNYNNMIAQDYIEGPADCILETSNFPVLSAIAGFVYNGDSPFQAEVYFINLAKIIQVKFAVPFFDVYDYRYPDFGVPVAVRGTINFKISDYRNFIRIHRLENFDVNDLQNQIKDAVIRYVKKTVANVSEDFKIPVVQLERKTADIIECIESELRIRLREDFGIDVSAVDISAIDIDKSSDSYERLMSITRDAAAATIETQTAVNIKEMQDKQRIDSENYRETLRIQREESQYAQHKQTQTANITAYQTEIQGKVGMAGATALGQMGSSGVTGDSNGLNIASMMTGMVIGNTVGQNIAGTINSAMNGSSAIPVPPPIPSEIYHVVIDGKSNGPFDMAVIRQMIISRQIKKETLIWKAGMSDWVQADNVEELKSSFVNVPPELPV